MKSEVPESAKITEHTKKTPVHPVRRHSDIQKTSENILLTFSVSQQVITRQKEKSLLHSPSLTAELKAPT